jgi:leucine efflux protein
MFLAWAGVAALIQTTPVLFNIVRYLGAFYLLWLGGKMLWSVITRQNNAHANGAEPASAIMKRALVLSLTNPKRFCFTFRSLCSLLT